MTRPSSSKNLQNMSDQHHNLAHGKTISAPSDPTPQAANHVTLDPTMQSIDEVELLGVDWGTTNLRVMRIGNDGRMLESRHDPRGASKVKPGEFGTVLRDVMGDWADPDLPVLVCGMAGGRNGWLETEYRECPVSLETLAPVKIAGEELDISIVPGVSLHIDGVLVDVMRGEETQVMGLQDSEDGALIVTPGTHSKWISFENESIVSFRTFLTGDLFAAIRAETLLGHEMGDAGSDLEAFETGVRRALDDNALTANLFSVRTYRLSGQISESSTADYLSGLLVGAEVAAQRIHQQSPIVVLGTNLLCSLYARALQIAGSPNVKTLDATNAAATGLWRIRQAML